jgi:hypothetical protein
MEEQMTEYRFNEKNFWSRVSKTDTCWNWTGCLTKGYGMSRAWKGDKNRMVLAHRLSYFLANGACPDEIIVDHICHNRSCVNPGHLREATNKQNNEHRSGAQSNSKSGIRGIGYEPNRPKPWRARVTHNRQVIQLGRFATSEEAEAAVKAKRIELFTHNDLDRVA